MTKLAEHLISYLLDEAVFPVQQLDKAERVLDLSKEDIVNTVEQFDPTPTKDYSVWILKQWMFKNVILPEDGHRVLTVLTHYDKQKRKADSQLQKDINRYRTIHDLEMALEEEIPSLKATAVEVGHKVKDLPGVTVVKRVPPDIVVLKVEDPDSLATLGEGTRWCTRRSYPDCQAESYIDDYGYIYVVLKQGKPFVQYTPDYDQIKDVDNETFEDIGIRRQILMEPESPSAQSAFNYAKAIKSRVPKLEPILARYPSIAVHYAVYVLGGERFLQAEPVIAKNPKWALKYAEKVLQGSFPEAEPFIAKNAEISYRYAVGPLKGRRFLEGEAAIASQANFAYLYASQVIKGRFPLAEPVLQSNPDFWEAYHKYVVPKR